MAKNKRPKWLDAETPELMNILKEILAADEITDKDQAKAAKIVDELIARLPSEDQATLSVAEAIAAAKACMDNALDGVKAAYDHEVSIISDTEADDEEEEDEEPAEPASKSKKKSKEDKKSKKSKKTAIVEEAEDDSDDDEEEEEEDDSGDGEEDYSDWSTKELKKECRERGIKVTKSMGKAELVKALEADDKE